MITGCVIINLCSMMHMETVIRCLVTKHVPGKPLKAIIAQQLLVRC